MSRINNRSREPPPALFLHPSPGASRVSLASTSAPGYSTPRREQSNLERSTSIRCGSILIPDLQRNGRAGSTRSTDKTDALWAEMQATLEEVELSASGGTHVFGSGHSQKLSELRSAQIRLAQAWARSEADEVTVTGLRDQTTSSGAGDVRNMHNNLMNSPSPNTGNGIDHIRSTNRPPGGGRDVRDEGLGMSEPDLDEESEMDIVLGRKRREANDKYFQRVNKGVIDVVAKLEDVAVAMHAVEQESQPVWNEGNASC